MTKKHWFRIHSFTGIITGLLLFVICWSGTFAVLALELDWLVTPEARIDSPVDVAQLDWQAMKEAVETAYPEAQFAFAEAPLNSRASAQFVVNLPEQPFVRVYVDPNGNEVLGHHSYFSIQRFFRDFHRNLFLPGNWGSYLVLSFTVTLAVSLIAALYFYKRWWTRFFRFKPGKAAFWSEVHKTAGLWCIWFMLVMVLTGAWYLFESLRLDVGDGIVNYAGNGDFAQYQISLPGSSADATRLPLNTLLERFRQERPDITIATLGFNYLEGALYVDGQSDTWLVRDRANQVYMDAATGEILYNQYASGYPAYWRLSDTADPLHFGDFAGLPVKLVWFVFGLVLSGLILTGTWLHVRRLAREGQSANRHRWTGTTAAMLTSLVILALSVPYAFASASYYGVSPGASSGLALAPGVRWFIMAWAALTVAIIAAWVALLWRPGWITSQKPARKARAERPTSTEETPVTS